MKEFKQVTTSTAAYAFSEILNILKVGKKYRITVSEFKKRSLSANSQQHVFYQQISDFRGDMTPLQVKNMCKDMFGLPILLQSDEHRAKTEFLLHKLEYGRYSYESKMKLIQCLRITSEFNTSESKRYMDDMIIYFNDNGIAINYTN